MTWKETKGYKASTERCQGPIYIQDTVGEGDSPRDFSASTEKTKKNEPLSISPARQVER